MNMDYSFCQALKHANMKGIKSCIGIYDVNCQYYKRFWGRISGSPYLSVPEYLEILWGIGLFHVHGHLEACLSRFAPTYIKGAGQVDGEIVETLWSVLNESSRSTRGATLAHRAELLNSHMNDSNWKKLVQMGEIVYVTLFRSMLTDSFSLSLHYNQKVYPGKSWPGGE
jgi:hypothetical protein